MRAAGYLVRLWLLACLVLLATTHEEAEEYYGVDQGEDFARVAEQDTAANTDGAWNQMQKAAPKQSGQSDLVSSVRRRLSTRVLSSEARASRSKEMLATSGACKYLHLSSLLAFLMLV